jgi:hypothetical protein
VHDRLCVKADNLGEVRKSYQGETRGSENFRRIRAFVLLLRYSGLRIQDAATLSRNRGMDGKLLFLYTAKQGSLSICTSPALLLNL